MTTPANRRLPHVPAPRPVPVERATAARSEHDSSTARFGIDLTAIPARGVPIAPADDRLERAAADVADRVTGTARARNEGAHTPAAPVAPGAIGSGRPLSDSERARFEPGVGADLSQVRLHTDGAAQESARRLHASAYTVGSHIVFGHNSFAPQNSDGAWLLAHELDHTRQHAEHDQPAVIHRDPLPDRLHDDPALSEKAKAKAEELEKRTGRGYSDLVLSLNRGPIDINPFDLERALIAAGTLKPNRTATNDPRIAGRQTVLDEVLEPYPYMADRMISSGRIGTAEEVAAAQESGQAEALGIVKRGLYAAAGAERGGASKDLVTPRSGAAYGPPRMDSSGVVSGTPVPPIPTAAPIPVSARPALPPPSPPIPVRDPAKFVVAFGRSDSGYMNTAERNTGLIPINIQDKYNGPAKVRGGTSTADFFPNSEVTEQENLEHLALGKRLYPMFSGVMAQEALEGNAAKTAHFDLRRVDPTPTLPGPDAPGLFNSPGFSGKDFHSSSEARQGIAYLASTAPGERKVTIVLQHDLGVSTITPDSNIVQGSPLPPDLAKLMPNLINPTTGATGP